MIAYSAIAHIVVAHIVVAHIVVANSRSTNCGISIAIVQHQVVCAPATCMLIMAH